MREKVRLLSNRFHLCYYLLKQGILRAEEEPGTELLARKKKRQPVDIVRPHRAVWNIGKREPLWPHLFGFHRFAVPGIDPEHMHLEDFSALGVEFELVDADFLHFGDHNTALLFCFPSGRRLDRFSRFHLAPEAVPASRPEAALLHPEKHFAVFHRQAEGQELSHRLWFN